MTSTRKITAAVALTGALIAAPAIAAETSTPGTQTPSSSSSSSSGSSSSSSTPSSSSSSSSSPSTSISDGKGNSITLRLDDKGKIDKSALPKESTLLAADELRSIVPGLQSADFSDGTLTLTVKGEENDNRSRIVIKFDRFGTKADVTKGWDADKKAHQARAAKNPGLYTFAGPGKNGVADSFSDGTTTYVLLTNGDAAGQISFSGIGFSSLGDTHASARKAYRDTVVPKLVQLLGEKVRAGGPSKPPAATSSASPSSGSSSSSSSTSSSSGSASA